MEHIGTSTNGKGKNTGRGRMDAEKQPAVKKPQIIAESADEGAELYAKAKKATEKFADFVNERAEAAGYLAGPVRKIYIAKAGEKLEEEHRKCEQQLELFKAVAE